MSKKRYLPFRPNSDGSFTVDLPDDYRQLLASLAEQIDEVVTEDTPFTKRLFPTAYPDDAERDAGYQIFARDQLINERKSAADTVLATAHNETLTEDELSQWMAVINDARLIIGTYLDVSEDDEDEVSIDDPDFDRRLIYEELGLLLHNIVVVLTQTLPEPSDPED